jgi:hypothetical protein
MPIVFPLDKLVWFQKFYLIELFGLLVIFPTSLRYCAVFQAKAVPFELLDHGIL